MSSTVIARLSRSTGLFSNLLRTSNVMAAPAFQMSGSLPKTSLVPPPQPLQIEINPVHSNVPSVGDFDDSKDVILTMNRNMREPRKANHGARPCSNVRRKRRHKTRANEHPYIPSRRKKGYDY